MTMPTISKTIFNSSIKLARTPFDLAIGALGGSESQAKHLIDRAEAGARSATGVLFRDDDLRQEGRTARLATKERERAVRLREKAEVHEREASERQAEVSEAAKEAAAEARRKAERANAKAEKTARLEKLEAKEASIEAREAAVATEREAETLEKAAEAAKEARKDGNGSYRRRRRAGDRTGGI